jgi:hypothetical protein
MRFTDEEKERIWGMHQAGVPVKCIARTMRRQNVSLRVLISKSGGIRPRARVVNKRHLSLAEREEISGWLATSALAELDDEALDAMRPTHFGVAWPTRRILTVLLTEQVHHGAEIGVLRDLYRHRAAP